MIQEAVARQSNFEATRRSELLDGLRDTIPLIIGAAPFGLIFGALAITSGLSPAATMGMSLFVFAGSAQFIAAGLVAAGTGVAVIIATTFIVNVRHALYSATLAPHVRELPHWWLAPLGFWLTDETFAVAVARYLRDDKSPWKHWYFFGSALAMYLNWQLWTFVGVRTGQAIPNAADWGLDFAMVVTFIGLLVPFVRSRATLLAVLLGAATAVALNPLPHKLGLMAAALVGVAVGTVMEQRN